MVVNNDILKIIVRECCDSLFYNDEEQQFSFKLKPYQSRIWNNIKAELQAIYREFYLADFNSVLLNMKDAVDRFYPKQFNDFSDSEIMNGEVLEFSLTSKETIVFVKMKGGQYLDVATGKGVSMGLQHRYKKGCDIINSEGVNLGKCRSIHLRVPQKEHISLSYRFIGTYYRHPISSSLWPIYEEACGICSAGRTTKCQNLLNLAKANGINSFTLLNILKGASAWKTLERP